MVMIFVQYVKYLQTNFWTTKKKNCNALSLMGVFVFLEMSRKAAWLFLVHFLLDIYRYHLVTSILLFSDDNSCTGSSVCQQKTSVCTMCYHMRLIREEIQSYRLLHPGQSNILPPVLVCDIHTVAYKRLSEAFTMFHIFNLLCCCILVLILFGMFSFNL
jgi:hypothetical protein